MLSPDPVFYSSLENSIQAIQCGNPVGFRHGRVIERGIDEVVQRVGLSFLIHDRLADVNDFCGLVTETVDTQNLAGLPVEQDFQHAYRFSGNLRAGQILEERLSNLVRHLGFSQFTLGFPTELISGMV